MKNALHVVNFVLGGGG